MFVTDSGPGPDVVRRGFNRKGLFFLLQLWWDFLIQAEKRGACNPTTSWYNLYSGVFEMQVQRGAKKGQILWNVNEFALLNVQLCCVVFWRSFEVVKGTLIVLFLSSNVFHELDFPVIRSIPKVVLPQVIILCNLFSAKTIFSTANTMSLPKE